ncbi:hypothetical protein TURU_017582 [Turdus rufiventris]|nr:hypothetical protein TURU_017582 [Turdus rufiventris]
MKLYLALFTNYDQGLFVQVTVQTNNLNTKFFHNKFTIHTSDQEAKSGYEKVNKAALSALKQFSEQGLDPVEGAMKVENGSHEKQVKHLGEKADNKQTNSGTIAQDCKDSKAVV